MAKTGNCEESPEVGVKRISGLVRFVTHHVMGFRGGFKRIALAGSGVVITRAAAFLLGVLVARLAGAQTFGEFSIFTTLFVFVSEVGNALDICYFRHSVLTTDDSQSTDHRLVHLLSKSIYAVVVASAGYVAAPEIAGRIFAKPEAVSLVREAISCGALYTVYAAMIAWEQARRHFGRVAILMAALNVLVVVGVIVLGLIRKMPTQDLLSEIYLFSTVILLAVAVGALVAERPLAFAVKRGWRNYARTGLVLIAANAITIGSARLDMMFMARFASYADIGHYGVALRIALLLGLMQAVVTVLFVPEAAAAVQDEKRLLRYKSATAIYSIFQLVTALGLAACSGLIIVILFGADYSSVRPIAIVLIFQSLFSSWCIPFQALIQNGPRPRVVMYLAAFRLLLGFMLMLALVPRFGSIGAAFAMLGTTAVGALMLVGVTMHGVRARNEAPLPTAGGE